MKHLEINNFREVSGYINKFGKVMKSNKIFRGASLEKISLKDAKYKEEVLHISHILDFRDENEATAKKDVLSSGMKYERISALIVGNQRFKGFDFGDLLNGIINM